MLLMLIGALILFVGFFLGGVCVILAASARRGDG
jgi:hypothetical protein